MGRRPLQLRRPIGLAAMPEYAGASRVALYAALPRELGTWPLFRAVRRDGESRALPPDRSRAAGA